MLICYHVARDHYYHNYYQYALQLTGATSTVDHYCGGGGGDDINDKSTTSISQITAITYVFFPSIIVIVVRRRRCHRTGTNLLLARRPLYNCVRHFTTISFLSQVTDVLRAAGVLDDVRVYTVPRQWVGCIDERHCRVSRHRFLKLSRPIGGRRPPFNGRESE